MHSFAERIRSQFVLIKLKPLKLETYGVSRFPMPRQTREFATIPQPSAEPTASQRGLLSEPAAASRSQELKSPIASTSQAPDADADAGALVEYVAKELKKLGDKETAVAMAKYMKSSDPFFGVTAVPRAAILKQIKEKFPYTTFSTDTILARVRRLWAQVCSLFMCMRCVLQAQEHLFVLSTQPHREERYLAVGYLRGMLITKEHRNLQALDQRIVDMADHMIRTVILR
jgi:hypothetical protein